jgi:putative peptidoglycan lipid II flippase
MTKKWLPSLIGLSIFAMLGRLLGFIREILIASNFGATEITDSYLTALILFDMALAANASFLQGTFAYSAENKAKAGFDRQLYKIGFKIFSIILVCAVIFYPLANYIIPLFYSRSPQATETIIKSSQLFFILASFLSASGVFAALLQMRGNLTNPGRLVLFLNVLSIIFLIVFKNNFGIISIPLGFLFGGALFFAYQIILIKKDKPLHTEENRTSEFCFSRWMIVSFLIFTNALFPSIMGLVERYFAYSFVSGSFSHYQYSQKILQLPFTILSFAISTSLLPLQVKSINEKNEDEFNSATGNGILISVFTSAFFVIIFYTLAEPVVQIIFQRGEFYLLDTLETSSALRILSFGLIPFLLNPIIANIYFSRNAVKKLLFINLAFVVFQGFSLSFFSKYMPGVEALTTSWVVVAWLNSIILIIFALKKKYFTVNYQTHLKIFLILAFTVLTSYLAGMLLPYYQNPWLNLMVSGSILFTVYLLVCLVIIRKDLSGLLRR